MNTTIKTFLYSLAMLLLLTAVTDMVLWFIACGQYDDFEQTRQAYLSRFPEGLRGRYTITLITTAMLAGSTTIFAYCSSMGVRKKLSLGLTIFSAFLLAWHIFSLM